MAENQTILEGYSDLEKGAYLCAIASIASADREASEEELQHMEELCRAAHLTPQQTNIVLRAATELSGAELNECLDVLKNSKLKYSLVADLMAFARSDNEYSEEEEQTIQKISQYLGLDQKQLSLLDQFTQEATQSAEASDGKPNPQGVFSGGLKEKMQNAGIDTGSLMTGILGIAAPLLIGSMFSRRLGRGYGMGGYYGGFGGFGMGTGLGSIIGMLSGGRGMRSTGGLFGRLFGRRRW